MKIKTGELAEKLQAKLIGDPNVVITNFSEVEDCESPGTVVLAIEKKALQKLAKYKPGIVVLNKDIPTLNSVKLITTKGKEVLIEMLNIFFPEDTSSFISKAAHIAVTAVIGPKTRIYPGVYIGENVTIGQGTVIYPNTVVYDGCKLGERCIVHSNAVIGADGFGFIQKDGKNIKVPQQGIVVIGNDVEIGAGTTIDRATLKATVIGDGTKIDNKVQVGHNVQIGQNCIIVAGANIGGSTVIEDNVIVAGGAGIVDNVRIGKNSVIYAYTVATSDCPPNSKLYATPAGDDYLTAMKRRAIYNKLPELFAEQKQNKKKKNED